MKRTIWMLATCAAALPAAAATFGPPAFGFGTGEAALPVETEGSFALVEGAGGGQTALARPLKMLAMALRAGETARATVPVEGLDGPFKVVGEAVLIGGGEAGVWLELGSAAVTRARLTAGRAKLEVSGSSAAADTITVGAACNSGETAVRWQNVCLVQAGQVTPLDFFPAPAQRPPFPALRDVAMRPILEPELVEWDWRMQDGIGLATAAATFEAAIENTLARADVLRAWLRQAGASRGPRAGWAGLRAELAALRLERAGADDARWEDLWRRVHAARRKLALSNPIAQTGPLVFAKHVPGAFSHQLTQYYGRYARPGGGLFVLERPGESMAVRQLGAGALPQGSYMQPEVTRDGQAVLAAFCATDTPPKDTLNGDPGRYYHLYEFALNEGLQAGRPHHNGQDETNDDPVVVQASRLHPGGVRQLTDGPHDDFAPRELPDGDIVFISTRRGGWHRCGGIGCPVYTLTRMKRDGSAIRTISFHETQEWDPAVLNDGRLIYTRWDYVDRNAVHYQQLWTTRPDGSMPIAYYGNNTLSPAGIWEARAVPGSQLVMATAAAHHAMTAGSIVLVDVRRGVDGPEPLTRLTPDAPFPETEAPLPPHWRAPYAVEPPEHSPEMDRWPGQCYKSAWPISEDFFLAAYSYDPLIGEPVGNAANMFGLYLVDAFGNKELIYRDLNISSIWPVPLRPRNAAPAVMAAGDPAAAEGAYFLHDVYESDTPLARGSVKRLRVVQVLPKGTPIANQPRVGVAYASPGKQVLGTVPVEPDGSAYFTAPAGIPLAFQALDERGQALHIMRSLTYLQPGETASCTGCHEPRLSAPPPARGERPMALQRPASAIEPGPDGSKPLSYPILVQPVLDRLCIQCHSGDTPAGPEGKPITLTGEPEGEFSRSYNNLAERVAYSCWNKGNVFPEGNGEPATQPGAFGAIASPLMQMLQKGHHEVQLTPDDLDRLTTWMDANGLFYGTFDFEAQKRQQRGERIEGPSVE